MGITVVKSRVKKAKTIEKLAKQKKFSRNDMLIILNKIYTSVYLESSSSVSDVQEELGFGRFEEAN